MNGIRSAPVLLALFLCLAPADVQGQSPVPTCHLAQALHRWGGDAVPESHATDGPTSAARLRGSTPASVVLYTPAPMDDRAHPRPHSTLPVPQVRDRGGVPYMVAGGILFVAGVIAGGDAGTLLMLGGAGTGAYGAFIYFGG